MNVDLSELELTLLPTSYMQELMRRCIDEDGGVGGDITTNSIISEDATSRFAIHARGNGTLSGLQPIAKAMGVFDDLKIVPVKQDADCVSDERIATLEGATRSILLAERTILNILGHASGVATKTRAFVAAVTGTNCCVCDTRKTTPGLRMLDKYAVACGGGTLHRLGLHDAALYKDNHLANLKDFSAKLGDALLDVKKKNEIQFAEVEVDSLEQLEKVLDLPVDIVLLDNMTNDELSQAVAMRNKSTPSILLEASGGVTLETVRAVAETGVDRVAIGALTHDAPWLDIGLDKLDA